MVTKVQAHVAYQLGYHIVWIPKYRREIFVSGVKEYLEKIIKTSVIDRYPDVHIHEINIQKDHVHALIEIPPKYSISSVVGYIKGVSSKKLRMHFVFLQHARALWANGFFVSSVGRNEENIRKYIKYQNSHDFGQAKLV